MMRKSTFYIGIIVVMAFAAACAGPAATSAPTAAAPAGGTSPTAAVPVTAPTTAVTTVSASTSVASTSVASTSVATSAATSMSTSVATSVATSAATSAPVSGTPVKIGVSLSLSGDFSDDGKAFQQGYQLWADWVNSHGGLLGRPVTLDILSDASSTDQVQTNYQKLITVDKVDLVFGPFSTLLTKPASVVAHRYGYALVEGAGGGPSVFQQGLNNVFDVSLPVANNLDNFVPLLQSLSGGQKPTIAYATEDDPFTQPQIDRARQLLEAAGFKTVSYQVYPAETTDFNPIADKIIASNAQVVVAGTQFPDSVAFVQRFRQQHYNPQAYIATGGPDQGSQFLSGVGGANVAEGVMVPNGWYPSASNPGNTEMVQAYIAKYGGKPADISADVAEGYSVGQVVYQAIQKTNSLDNGKLIAELHSGDTFQSVQGPVKFDQTGQNTVIKAFIFQWQNGNFVPVYPQDAVGAAKFEFPKPQWP